MGVGCRLHPNIRLSGRGIAAGAPFFSENTWFRGNFVGHLYKYGKCPGKYMAGEDFPTNPWFPAISITKRRMAQGSTMRRLTSPASFLAALELHRCVFC